MSEKRQRRDNAAEFFLFAYADGDNEMLLFGRDASGGSVCVRVPYERTLYLLPQRDNAEPRPPAIVAGVVRCERVPLERAFPQQGASGVREWLVVTYRSACACVFAEPPPSFEAVAQSNAPTEAFLVARRIKCARWLTLCGAQLVPRERQLTSCHAEYVAADVVESADGSRAPPAIVVLRASAGGTEVRVESIDGSSGARTVLAEIGDGGDVLEAVLLHQPDVLSGSLERFAARCPLVRFRDAGSRYRRAHLETPDSAWHALLLALASHCPLGAAIESATAASAFVLLHAMHERGFLPVLPPKHSHARQELPGGHVSARAGLYRGIVRHYDFRSLYPSLVIEHGIDLRGDDALHTPLLPALMKALVDARDSAPTTEHAAAFKATACKLVGCLGSQPARMYCPAVNASIVNAGREALRHAIAVVQRERLGTVIAYFTDSLLVHEDAAGAADGSERLTALINRSYTHVRLVLKDEWVCVYVSTKANRYAALDSRSVPTIKGLLAVTQPAAVQQAIRSACRQLLSGADLVIDAATLELPVQQRQQVCAAIVELCAMARGTSEADVRRQLQLSERAMQRVKSLSLAAIAGVSTNGSSVPDHALRPGVAASDAPPRVVPIEELFEHLPLCMLSDADAIADARDNAPAAYPHMQRLYLGLRSCGLSHASARDSLVHVSPPYKRSKRAPTLDGMRTFAQRAFDDDVRERGGDERAASCLWPCAQLPCPYKRHSAAAAKRATLLAKRHVSADEMATIEQLVAQGNYGAACAHEFAARHNGRSLVGGAPQHPALYVQKSFE